MKNIIGIHFNKDTSGKEKSVTIDLNKYGNDLQNFLEKIGAVSKEDVFDKRWNEAITGNELVKKVQTHIKTLPW